ncbi:MAG: SDR family NAD(P)-dependent oxidoreductase [Nakamurella sp.]
MTEPRPEPLSGSRFTDRVVLVTGGGSGIGRATAKRFADEGASVVVADINEERARAVADEITEDGRDAVGFACDIGTSAGWAALAELVQRRHGKINVVHNNAFTVEVAPAGQTSEASWDRQIAVDLSAVYHSVRVFITGLQQTKGCIVNTSSVHALMGFPGHPAYAAAKGGIVALTRQLAVDYGPDVRVNAVLPGCVMTRAWDKVDQAGFDANVARTTAGRIGEPAEVAAAVAFLASDEASYITGTSLVVDGGMTALGVR